MKNTLKHLKLGLCISLEILAYITGTIAVVFIILAQLAADWEKQDEQR